jgi:hypothetical protein
MIDYVEIVTRRFRGYPWPDDSWGLTPMYGSEGWCRSCGVPQGDQTGSIVLRAKSFPRVAGCWVPNWQFDAYCLEAGIAKDAAHRFGIGLRDIEWRGTPGGSACQVVIPPAAVAWFDPNDLERIIEPIHGAASNRCDECGVGRWLPVGMDVLPSPPSALIAGEPAVIVSKEWFGDGKQSFRKFLWRRDVAEFLVESSPRDFRTGASIFGTRSSSADQ